MLLNWLSFEIAYQRGSTGFSIIQGFSYQYLGKNRVKIKTLHILSINSYIGVKIQMCSCSAIICVSHQVKELWFIVHCTINIYICNEFSQLGLGSTLIWQETGNMMHLYFVLLVSEKYPEQQEQEEEQGNKAEEYQECQVFSMSHKSC